MDTPTDTIFWPQPTSTSKATTIPDQNPKNWVCFDNNEENQDRGEFVTIPFDKDEPAILPTTFQMVNDSIDHEKETITTSTISTNESEEKKFKNGQIIVNIYPVNDSCDWVTPAKFKAHLVPEELMAKSLTMTVEDYVNNVRMLINDYRFKCYIIFYKRIVALWATLSVGVLLAILFSGWIGVTLFIAAMSWMLGNCLGLVIVIFAKKHMNAGLAECIGQVNEQFLKHNILIGVDDAGNYSCHKVNIVFIYCEPKACIEYLRNNLSDRLKDVPKEANNMFSVVRMTWDNTVHTIDTADIIITGPSNSKTIPQKEVKLVIFSLQLLSFYFYF